VTTFKNLALKIFCTSFLSMCHGFCASFFSDTHFLHRRECSSIWCNKHGVHVSKIDRFHWSVQLGCIFGWFCLYCIYCQLLFVLRVSGTRNQKPDNVMMQKPENVIFHARHSLVQVSGTRFLGVHHPYSPIIYNHSKPPNHLFQ